MFDLHSDRVFRHAFGLLHQRADAEDVTAATFLELWRRSSRVRLVEGSTLPWLLVTCTHIAQNVRRATARYRQLLDSLPHAETAPSAEDAVLDGMALDDTLSQALRSLKPTDQALVTLVDIEGYPIRHAAEAIGISAGNARVRLHRARGRLRADLAQSPQSQEGVAHV